MPPDRTKSAKTAKAEREYACISFYAEMLRAEEDADEKAFGLPVPRKSPAEHWALAQRIHRESMDAKALQDRRDTNAAGRAAADPRLALAEERFNAAKETCRTGHDAGCTYGGMSYQNGYWLALEECDLNHGALCDLRVACNGAEAATGFAGRAEDGSLWGWIWSVAACQPCADVYVTVRPEWTRPTPEQKTEREREAEAYLAEMRAATAERRESRLNSPEHDRLSPDVAEQVRTAAEATGHLEPARWQGFAALFGEPVQLIPTVTPVRDTPPFTGLLATLGGVLSGDPGLPSVRLPPRPASPEDRLPSGGRNVYIGCHEIDGTIIHGRPHSCPVWARGTSR